MANEDGMKLAYDLDCTDHSKCYPVVVKCVTDEGALSIGHPARLSSDNPERHPGHVK